MVAGAARRIYKKVDPYRELRPGHTWVMDIVTPSCMSSEGYRYVIVLCDVGSGVFKCIPLYSRSGVYDAVGEWVSEMRSDPLYANMSYPIVSKIDADNAGEWSRENERWKQLTKDHGFTMKYSCPDRR